MPALRLPLLCCVVLLQACAQRPVLLPPPPPPEVAAPPVAAVPVQPVQQGLVPMCRTALPAAHPWRARQIKTSILKYELSRSYHSGAARMSPRDLHRAQAEENEAWAELWDTCRPALAAAGMIAAGER